MNLILFGYRGCGKTTLGKKLAAQLWKDFVDVDQQVCKRFDSRSIADIWATDGEPAFRAAEAQVAVELIQRENHVIALGGGTLMHPDARRAIKDASDVKRIYLECTPEELHRRIHADAATADTRPDLTAGSGGVSGGGAGGTSGGGLEEIKQVLAERDPIYREAADHVFEVTHTNPDEAARFIVAKFL
jgi:shikimate kinase